MVESTAASRRDKMHARLADPDAVVAYRSLEDVLAIGRARRIPGDVPPLVDAVLRSYARALESTRRPDSRIAWAAFIRASALLYFALNRHRERYADPCWRRAAFTLRRIALENADLLVGTAYRGAP